MRNEPTFLRTAILPVLLALPFSARGAEAPVPPVTSDRFQDAPFERWSPSGGRWATETVLEIYDVDKRDIYISPEEPSHLAWVGLWKEPDGSLKTCFAQITGDPGVAPSYAPWYGDGRSREQWLEFAKQHKLQPGPENAVSATTVEFPTLQTRDGGKTWQNLGSEQKPRGPNLRFAVATDGTYVNHGISTLCCRDGRLISTPWIEEWRQGDKYVWDECLLAVRESLDNGKTWLETQFIRPAGADPDVIRRSGEESGMVELDDGRILVIVRCDPGSPVQCYLTRVGPGRYEATVPTPLPFANAGMPEVARCRDGAIWYYGIDGHWYTLDDGQSWHQLPQRFTSYYGKMSSVGQNRILCVSQKGVGDGPYPNYQNATIAQVAFSYRRAGVMRQQDAAAPLALLRRTRDSYENLHLRATVKLDAATGLAFRVSPDGQSYYVFAIIMPGSETYERWFPPENQADVLSATYPKLFTFPGE